MSAASDKSALTGLVKASRAVGRRPEYVQGGGGNTSLKVSGSRMLVKASGCLLKEVTSAGRGFVAVDHRAVRDFFEAAPDTSAAEKASAKVIADSTTPVGRNVGRASIEAGFHSLLGRCVIHTHSVYANVIACSRNGEALLPALGRFGGVPVAWVPYARPGFKLTKSVAGVLEDFRRQHGRAPAVLMLQNHGIIVSADSSDKCLELHERVNARIQEYLFVTEKFPLVRLKEEGDGVYADDSGYLNRHLIRKGADGRYFIENVICPDQIVYGCGGLTFRKSGKEPVFVDGKSGKVFYRGTRKEAESAAETLTGVAYVLDEIDRLGLRSRFLGKAAVKAVLGMDAEKYRQQLLKK